MHITSRVVLPDTYRWIGLELYRSRSTTPVLKQGETAIRYFGNTMLTRWHTLGEAPRAKVNRG